MSGITLTQADNGKTVDVPQGDAITILLPENPTTGFRWAIAQTNNQVVTIDGDDYTVAAGSGIGGGGTRSLVLKALQPGTVFFQLKLWREWEGDSSIRDRFEVTIRVV